MIDKLQELAEKYSRKGIDTYYKIIRREGLRWGRNRVLRIYRLMRLGFRRKGKRRLPARFKRFYALLSVFEIMGSTDEFKLLTIPNSMNNFSSKDNEPMQKVRQYILQNFQRKIQTDNLLEISCKSYASFYPAFKRAFQMPFKDYLVNVRVGYACKWLAEGSMNISEKAYQSGFENISNFNRQFKKIKRVTPSQFQKQYKSEVFQQL